MLMEKRGLVIGRREIYKSRHGRDVTHVRDVTASAKLDKQASAILGKANGCQSLCSTA